MFSSIQGFGQQAFLSLVTIAAVIVASSILKPGKLKAVETVTVTLLLIIIGIQYYYLVEVATYLPATKHWIYNPNISRKMCVNSDKGGKRPAGSFMEHDINPCFCKTASSRCYEARTSKDVSYSFDGPDVDQHTDCATEKLIEGDCPTDGTAYCMKDLRNTTEVPLYLSSDRDCQGAQFDKCTVDQPCYPCELSQIIAFNSTRCRTCSSDFSGNCNFVEGVGPYCYQTVGSRKVGPCKTCCTEPQIIMLNNNETCV